VLRLLRQFVLAKVDWVCHYFLVRRFLGFGSRQIGFTVSFRVAGDLNFDSLCLFAFLMIVYSAASSFEILKLCLKLRVLDLLNITVQVFSVERIVFFLFDLLNSLGESAARSNLTRVNSAALKRRTRFETLHLKACSLLLLHRVCPQQIRSLQIHECWTRRHPFQAKHGVINLILVERHAEVGLLQVLIVHWRCE
jgi:hypothetical protein